MTFSLVCNLLKMDAYSNDFQKLFQAKEPLYVITTSDHASCNDKEFYAVSNMTHSVTHRY